VRGQHTAGAGPDRESVTKIARCLTKLTLAPAFRGVQPGEFTASGGGSSARQSSCDEGVAQEASRDRRSRGTTVAITSGVSRQARRSYQPAAALPQQASQARCIPRGRILMSMLLNFVNSVVRDEEGQDLLEYALLVALIALVAIGAVGLAGNSVSTIFTNIATRLTTAAGA
jgi:pilus assembly protein Flp/PilA